jgi:prepilin-type N-terminal cleavage/methylation domain-containing protein
MKQRLNFGFTLIELLVVISIIGVLSAVVLGQLSTARSKGADAAIKSQMKNMVSTSLLLYEILGETYTGICNYNTAPNKFQSMKNNIPSNACSEGGSNGYRVYAPMNQTNQCGAGTGTDYLCVDATGNITMLNNAPAAGWVCPAVCS